MRISSSIQDDYYNGYGNMMSFDYGASFESASMTGAQQAMGMNVYGANPYAAVNNNTLMSQQTMTTALQQPVQPNGMMVCFLFNVSTQGEVVCADWLATSVGNACAAATNANATTTDDGATANTIPDNYCATSDTLAADQQHRAAQHPVPPRG